MTDFSKEVLDIVKMQVAVRAMTEEEIVTFMQKITVGIKKIANGTMLNAGMSEQNSVRERSIICLECGKSAKILTHRHLAKHGLDASSYRAKWGFKWDAPLMCKALRRARRKKRCKNDVVVEQGQENISA